jgi:hypothetical protein
VFLDKKAEKQGLVYDGYFEKKPNGILLKDRSGVVIAFVANGLKHRESPFVVSASFVERLQQVRYQFALSSNMDKFFNTVVDGEFYPNRNLKRHLENDASQAVKSLYGKVFSGIAC